MNSFATMDAASRPLAYAEAELAMDGVPFTLMAERFGTPLYCYSAASILNRTNLIQSAFAGVPHTICYAVKANSSLAILKMLAERGCGFDIVSGGELERVRRAASQQISRVVFSGVGKQAWEIDAALAAGILQFNVESEAELALLSGRAQALGRTAAFALRVNPDVFAETHPYISTGMSEHKFGIAIANAREVYQKAVSLPGLQPTGVSVHIGSQIRSVEPFVQALERVCTLVQQLRADGMNIRNVDCGGGLGVEYGSAGFDAEATVAAYAQGIRQTTREMDIHLLLEPGRFIVAQAGVLLSRVLYTKQNGSKRFVITDAAMNDLIRPSLYGAHHEIVPATRGEGKRETVDVVGPVCESGDFFARDRELPALHAGELVALLDAGAYGMSLSSHYNTRVRPAEVLVEDGTARMIRRRETFDDLFAPELA